MSHVVIDMQGCIKCLHCNAETKIGMPLLASDMIAMSMAFVNNHKSCRPTKEGN